MRECYKDTIEPPPSLPVRVTIEYMMAERVNLYWRTPSLDRPIPVGVAPFNVEKSLPDEEDITWVVRRILLNRSRVPSGMQAEHLHKRLGESKWEEVLDATYL